MATPLQAQAPQPEDPGTLFTWTNFKVGSKKIAEGAGKLYQHIELTINLADTKVNEKLNKYLPEKISKFAITLLRGLPIALLMMLSPTPFAFGMMAVGLLSDLIQPGVLGKRWSFRMYHSFGVYSALKAVSDIIKITMRKHILTYAAIVAFELLTVAYCSAKIK